MIYSHTAGDHRARTSDPVRFRLLPELFEKLFAVLKIISGKDHDKLISADPVNRAVLKCLADHAAGALKRFITVAVASRIIHELEVIHVAHYYSERYDLPFCPDRIFDIF